MFYPSSITELAFLKEHFADPSVHVGYRHVDAMAGILHSDYSTGKKWLPPQLRILKYNYFYLLQASGKPS